MLTKCNLSLRGFGTLYHSVPELQPEKPHLHMAVLFLATSGLVWPLFSCSLAAGMKARLKHFICVSDQYLFPRSSLTYLSFSEFLSEKIITVLKPVPCRNMQGKAGPNFAFWKMISTQVLAGMEE